MAPHLVFRVCQKGALLCCPPFECQEKSRLPVLARYLRPWRCPNPFGDPDPYPAHAWSCRDWASALVDCSAAWLYGLVNQNGKLASRYGMAAHWIYKDEQRGATRMPWSSDSCTWKDFAALAEWIFERIRPMKPSRRVAWLESLADKAACLHTKSLAAFGSIILLISWLVFSPCLMRLLIVRIGSWELTRKHLSKRLW